MKPLSQMVPSLSSIALMLGLVAALGLLALRRGERSRLADYASEVL